MSTDVQHIPCSIMKFSQDKQSGNLEKVKIVVMHAGENFNKTFFSDDSVNDAEPTLKNVPILAYIRRDEDGNAEDFDQHNVITKLVPNANGGHDVVQYYLERPIGVIPETNNYRIEEIDGENHVVVDGYIWKSYANEGYGIITESGEKGVSMEISIEDGKKDTQSGLYHINKYSYLGVTVLGDDMPPAMGDTCKLTTYSTQTEEYHFALQQIQEEVKKIKEEVTKMSANNDPAKEPVQEPVQNQEPPVEPTQTEPTEPTGTQEPVQANFSLSIDNMREGIRKNLSTMTTQKTNRWNETYDIQSYWLRTILPTDNMVVVEDGASDYTYYGVPFTVNGDDIVLDFDNKKEYIQTWREKQSAEELMVFTDKDEKGEELIDAKFTKMDETIKDLEGKLQNQESELTELRTFKLDKDNEALANEVNSIIANFTTLDEEDYKEVRDKALSKEMDIATFKTHMYALKGMKQEQLEKEQAENYTQKPSKATEPVRIPVTSQDTEPKTKPVYGSLYADLERIAKSKGKKLD